MSTAKVLATGSTSSVNVHGIDVTYSDCIGSYGTIMPVTGYERVGVSMGNHLQLLRQQTDTPAQMAGILRSKIDFLRAGMDSLDDPEREKVQSTIDVYRQFVSKASGNGDGQL